MAEEPLPSLVYRSYIRRHIENFLSYVMAMGEKSGWEEALKTLSSVQWKYGRKWAKENLSKLDIKGEDARAGWVVLRACFRRIAPVSGSKWYRVVKDTPSQVIVHRMDWNPILEACKKLDLPVRDISESYIVQMADAMLKTLNPKLSVQLGKIRPEANHDEYIIELEE